MTDDPVRLGLLREVIAHPDEDGPRLVFADWCEENGEPERAEFVRESLGSCLLGRLTSMLDVYGTRWALEDCGSYFDDKLASRSIRKLDGVGLRLFQTGTVTDFGYARGFLTNLTCGLNFWHAHAETILTRNPIRHVRLTNAIGSVARYWSSLDTHYTDGKGDTVELPKGVKIEFDTETHGEWQAACNVGAVTLDELRRLRQLLLNGEFTTTTADDGRRARLLQRRGHLTMNQYRRLLGLDHFVEGDRYRVSEAPASELEELFQFEFVREDNYNRRFREPPTDASGRIVIGPDTIF